MMIPSHTPEPSLNIPSPFVPVNVSQAPKATALPVPGPVNPAASNAGVSTAQDVNKSGGIFSSITQFFKKIFGIDKPPLTAPQQRKNQMTNRIPAIVKAFGKDPKIALPTFAAQIVDGKEKSGDPKSLYEDLISKQQIDSKIGALPHQLIRDIDHASLFVKGMDIMSIPKNGQEPVRTEAFGEHIRKQVEQANPDVNWQKGGHPEKAVLYAMTSISQSMEQTSMQVLMDKVKDADPDMDMVVTQATIRPQIETWVHKGRIHVTCTCRYKIGEPGEAIVPKILQTTRHVSIAINDSEDIRQHRQKLTVVDLKKHHADQIKDGEDVLQSRLKEIQKRASDSKKPLKPEIVPFERANVQAQFVNDQTLLLKNQAQELDPDKDVKVVLLKTS